MLLLAGAPSLGRLDPEGGLSAPSVASAAWWLGLALVTAQAVALSFARVSPLVVLVGCAAAAPVAAAAGLGDATGATSLAVLVAAFTVGLRHPVETSWPVLTVAALLVTSASVVTDGVGGSALLDGVGAVLLPVLAAGWVRGRREVQAAQEAQAQARAGEQVAQVQAAVARERTAMARELHDIAAHHLSGIAVMTGAVGGQIDTDPEGAKAGVRQVRDQSTALLRDLRSLVGLLRDGAADDVLSEGVARPEGLIGITALVEDARTSGTQAAVELRHRDEPLGAGIGPLAQLTAYRMVQESLANAARHAPGARCLVSVDDRDEQWLTVVVENERPVRAVEKPTESGGLGLVGMRERAELTDADLEHGPTDAGGWRVVLRLPRHAETGRGAR